MDNFENLESVLYNLKVEAPVGLSRKILENIALKKKKAAIFKIIISSVVGVLSAAGVIIAFPLVSQSFYSSGTTQIMSLLISDFQLMVSNSNDLLLFSLSLAESFPIIPVVEFLSATLFLLSSIYFGLINIRKVEQVKKMITVHA